MELLSNTYFTFHTSVWLLLIGTTCLGGFMRGFAGFGTTLIMVPIFSLFMSPTEAVLIGLSTDVLAMTPMVPDALKKSKWRPIIPILAGSILATPLGVYILIILTPDSMRIVIALLVIASALLLMSGWTYQGKQNLLLSFAVGVMSGTSGSAAAIGGPPIAVYMLALGLTASKTRASLNAMSFIKEGISAVSIILVANIDFRYLVIILILFPFMLIFTNVGSFLFGKVNDLVFKKLILIFLVFIGVFVLIRAFTSA